MSESPSRPPVRTPSTGDSSAFFSLLSAAIFLYVGFFTGLRGISGNAIYDGSVLGFVWMARIVGIGLLIVAGLAFVGQSWAAKLDAVLAGVAALGCLAVGAIWLAFGDMQGILILIFGLLNASAARSVWPGRASGG
jgi:hypothetical protein